MTQEFITQFNKKCTKFLDWKIVPKNASNKTNSSELYKEWLKPNGETTPTWKELHFHSDWNWIMEVVEKIENIKYSISVTGNFCHIAKVEENIGITLGSYQGSTKKEAVVQAINQFIDWYNLQNNLI